MLEAAEFDAFTALVMVCLRLEVAFEMFDFCAASISPTVWKFPMVYVALPSTSWSSSTLVMRACTRRGGSYTLSMMVTVSPSSAPSKPSPALASDIASTS